MDFTPNDGFCCPFVERLPLTSESEPMITKFLAWVKSLPFTPGRPKKYGSGYTSTVVALKDQPYVIKIVEEGYAFMFQGAFAPAKGGDTAGFDRIPYFELITSNFKEMQFPGGASEVVVCNEHKKKFLLGFYMKSPHVTDSWKKELGPTVGALELLGESCEVQGNNGISVTTTDPVTTGKDDGKGRSSLVSTEPNPEFHEKHELHTSPASRQSRKDSWSWL